MSNGNYITNPNYVPNAEYEQFSRADTPFNPLESYPDFDNDSFDFDDYPDFDSTLYCQPGSQPQTLEVSSQPPFTQEAEPEQQFNEIRFTSLHSLRGFIETSNIPLEDYVIIMPAKKYKSLRYDKRPSHANKCEFIMAKLQ